MIYKKHDNAAEVLLDIDEDSHVGIVNFGYETTKPDFQEISNRRKYTLIHFVTDGMGYLVVNGQYYRLSSGSAFVIFPWIPVSYGNTNADKPLEFSWIGFCGSDLINLLNRIQISQDHPVATFNDSEAIKQLICAETNAVVSSQQIDENNAEGLLLSCFLAMLKSAHTSQPSMKSMLPVDEQVRQIVSFINNNYNKQINVSDLCEIYHISRSSLWRTFQSHIGVSPAEYITKIRIDNACRILQSGTRVKDAAIAVGWPDPYFFSRIFKQKVGISPSGYARAFKP